ncbi:MAG: TlpA family protein disulfide reductase [Xanthomonadaceae bacterium]|nr:TlpA family protein disulfide reductase [Xanthomonadaceae bacterium]
MKMACLYGFGAALLLSLAACQPQQSGSTQSATAATRSKPAAVTAPVAKPAIANAQHPALRVTTLSGAAWDLGQQRGKWVIVNYWATWCGPCLQEMPELSALAAMRPHIAVIGLAYEDNTVDDLRAFMQAHPTTYPIALIDVYSPPKDFGAPRGLPTSWLIAPDGKLMRKYTGPVTASMLEQDIASFGGPNAD